VLGTARHGLPCAHRVDRFLFEPDPAVLAARLTAELADQHQLQAVAPGCVYLTGSRPVTDSALASFEVITVLPLQVKRLRALLRERGIGQLEIKRRGVSHDPQALRAQLRVPGDQCSTLLLARINQRVTAILAQRIGPPPPSTPC
jgi:hypothetical protein